MAVEAGGGGDLFESDGFVSGVGSGELAGAEDDGAASGLSEEVGVGVAFEGAGLPGEVLVLVGLAESPAEGAVVVEAVAGGDGGELDVVVGHGGGGEALNGQGAEAVGEGGGVLVGLDVQVDPGLAAGGNGKAGLGRVDRSDVHDGLGVLVVEHAAETQEHAEQVEDGVLLAAGHGGVAAAAVGLDEHLDIAVVAQAGGHAGRLGDDGPGQGHRLQQGGGAVAGFLLADDEEEADVFGALAGLDGTDEGLDHGRAASLHVGGAQAVDAAVLLLELVMLDVEGGDGVDVADEGDLGSPEDDLDVAAAVADLAEGDGQAVLVEGAGEELGDLLLAAAGAVDVDHLLEEIVEAVGLDIVGHRSVLAVEVQGHVDMVDRVGKALASKETDGVVVVGLGVDHQHADAVLFHNPTKPVEKHAGDAAAGEGGLDAQPDEVAVVPGGAGLFDDGAQGKADDVVGGLGDEHEFGL